MKRENIIALCFLATLTLTACTVEPLTDVEVSSGAGEVTSSSNISSDDGENDTSSTSKTAKNPTDDVNASSKTENSSKENNPISTENVEKITLADYIKLPENLKNHFESNTEKFKFDNDTQTGDTWYIEYAGPELPMMEIMDDDGNITPPPSPEEQAKLDEIFNWNSIGVILDITQDEPKVLYVHDGVVGLYSTVKAGESILDGFTFGEIITVKFDDDGNVIEIINPTEDKLGSREQSDEYWRFLDKIRKI